MQQVTSSQVARWAASSAWSTQRKQHLDNSYLHSEIVHNEATFDSFSAEQKNRSNKFNTAIFFCPGLQLHFLCRRRLCRRFDTFRGGWWLFCRHTSGDSLQRQSRSLHVVNGVMQQVQLIQFNANTNPPMPYCIANSTNTSNISFLTRCLNIFNIRNHAAPVLLAAPHSPLPSGLVPELP